MTKDFLKGVAGGTALSALVNILFGWNAIADLGLVSGSLFSVGCGMCYGVWKHLYAGWVGE